MAAAVIVARILRFRYFDVPKKNELLSRDTVDDKKRKRSTHSPPCRNLKQTTRSGLEFLLEIKKGVFQFVCLVLVYPLSGAQIKFGVPFFCVYPRRYPYMLTQISTMVLKRPVGDQALNGAHCCHREGRYYDCRR